MKWFAPKKKKNNNITSAVGIDEKRLLWNNTNFAATEAYNLLRTNVTLSFADEEGARLIGITSTEHAEGKSLTSVNLAASLAKAGNRTLLLEGDLRMPVIAKNLKLEVNTGVSEFLASITNHVEDAILPVEKCKNLSVICCGSIPPNPCEMLGSKRMENMLQELGKRFEYIIVDLPPIGAVPDALVLAKKLNGMIMVVRDNVTLQPDLADSIRQLRYTGAHILGFVYNGAESSGHGYGRKYYKKYARYGYKDGAYSAAKQRKT